MSSIRINGRSYEQVCGKYLVDVETNEYLQYNGTEFVHSVYTPAPAGSIDLLLFLDGKVVKFEDPSVVLGGGEQVEEEEDDVPVNRAAALIEEALNAKAAGCGCDCGCGADCTGCECDCGCPKTAPVVEEAPAVVEEAPAVVEEEVPELVEADAT